MSSYVDAGSTPGLDFSSLRGFNLLGKFMLDGSNAGYVETDFQTVRDFGFNFVRLPIDYRTYIVGGDPLSFDENSLRNIDEAVTWGMTYGVHVCLNLHRAPGYTVATPPEATSLWTDSTAQSHFRAHWEMFAERYKDVPAAALSFNLLNEPSGVTDEDYGAVMRPVIAAIRTHSPSRPILTDGIDYCGTPAESLRDQDVVQALRGYYPFNISHYKAEWVSGSDTFPGPVWPPPEPTLVSYFYGPIKAEYASPFELTHPFAAGTTFGITVHQVSGPLTLMARADDTIVFQKDFTPGPGTGEWNEVVYKPEWDLYQNIYDRTYEFVLQNPAQKLAIEVTAGDWLSITEFSIDQGGTARSYPPSVDTWGTRQTASTLDARGAMVPVQPTGRTGKDVLYEYLNPWISYRNAGGTIFVGEFGAYNKTPHDVVMSWMGDMLDVYRTEKIGYALWNLTGSFGVLDSERTDVDYEPYEGHLLDRSLLSLLQRTSR